MGWHQASAGVHSQLHVPPHQPLTAIRSHQRRAQQLRSHSQSHPAPHSGTHSLADTSAQLPLTFKHQLPSLMQPGGHQRATATHIQTPTADSHAAWWTSAHNCHSHSSTNFRLSRSLADISARLNSYAAVQRALLSRERATAAGEPGRGASIGVLLSDALMEQMAVPYLQQRYTGSSPKRQVFNSSIKRFTKKFTNFSFKIFL